MILITPLVVGVGLFLFPADYRDSFGISAGLNCSCVGLVASIISVVGCSAI